jgi:aspartyl-tRNA(Asn)/glutamyl-tRNA(Gln) amidotransferase subunit A
MLAESPSIADVARSLHARLVTSEAITERCLVRIADANPILNAFITVLADRALAEARQADREMAEGRDRGPLHGVPISLKDLIDLKGVPTTAASRVRQGHVARADAVVALRLRDAGAVLVGKTNLHEFAFGTTNEESAYGPARHPMDPSRSPGGSSGGSAVSIVAEMAYASIGTDTGGSIRIPAAACGLVGLKPTLGDIPTDGVVPLSTTLDHVGPLTRSVEDARLVYEVLRGTAPRLSSADLSASRIRVGVPREYFLELLDPQIAAGFDAACERLRAAGVGVENVAIPHAGDTAPIYLHIVLAEAAAYHARTLDTCPDDYTAGVRIRLEMGRYVLAEDYVRAMRGRERLRAEVTAALRGLDALLLPTLAVPATKLGVSTVRVGAGDEPVRNVMLRLTQLFNITGHPAITVPCGTTAEGLPIGAQLAGRVGETSRLLEVAEVLEPYLGPGRSR